MNISVQSESEFEIHPLHIQWVDVSPEEDNNDATMVNDDYEENDDYDQEILKLEEN